MLSHGRSGTGFRFVRHLEPDAGVARLDTDRWTNEGGRVAAEAAAPLR
jgi:hypothetical protein